MQQRVQLSGILYEAHADQSFWPRVSLRSFVCDYVTNNKDLMSSHVKIHSVEQPFVCDIDGCAKTFVFKNNFNRHRNTHYPGRLTCNLFGCKKRFKRKKHLNRHMGLYKCRSDGCLAKFRSQCQYIRPGNGNDQNFQRGVFLARGGGILVFPLRGGGIYPPLEKPEVRLLALFGP